MCKCHVVCNHRNMISEPSNNLCPVKFRMKGIESIINMSSVDTIVSAILLLTFSIIPISLLLLRLYWLLSIILRKSFRYSVLSFTNKWFSLSMPKDSLTRQRVITDKSENFGFLPTRGMFPSEFILCFRDFLTIGYILSNTIFILCINGLLRKCLSFVWLLYLTLLRPFSFKSFSPISHNG